VEQSQSRNFNLLKGSSSEKFLVIGHENKFSEKDIDGLFIQRQTESLQIILAWLLLRCILGLCNEIGKGLESNENNSFQQIDLAYQEIM
jgi:hypothetical protein